MKTLLLILAVCLCAAAPLNVKAQTGQGKITQTQADSETLAWCVADKAGPEGDLPPSGPARDRIVKAMEGGPRTCIGLIAAPCETAAGPDARCVRRESRAWLNTIILETGRRLPARNKAVWGRAVSAVQAQAVALCEAAAAISAWGGAAVTKKGKYGFSLDDRCVRDGIAEQALILLVRSRGN